MPGAMTDEVLSLPVVFLVAVGSALGGMARYILGVLIDRRHDGNWPAGTLTVNISGALLIGLVAAILSGSKDEPMLWALLVTGFLGSYTTVSAFSLQTLLLARKGRPGLALAHVGLSTAGCLVAAAIGLVMGNFMLERVA